MSLLSSHAWLIIMATGVVFLLAAFPLADYDTWFHLAGGRYIVTERAMPTVDIFSYTAADQPWRVGSWGFDVLAYLLTIWLGVKGLILIKATAVAALFLLIIAWYARHRRLTPMAIMWATIGLFALRGAFTVRPHTFALVILVAWLLAFDKYRLKHSGKMLLLLAAIQILWVNWHGSFLWGILLSGLYLIIETVRQRKLTKAPVLLFVIVLGSSLVHVWYGPAYLIMIVRDFFTLGEGLQIRETLPADVGTFLSLFGLVMIPAWLVVMIGSWRKQDWFTLISTIGITIVALMTVRFTRVLGIWLIMMAPLMYDSWSAIWRRKSPLNNPPPTAISPDLAQNSGKLVKIIALFFLIFRNFDLKPRKFRDDKGYLTGSKWNTRWPLVAAGWLLIMIVIVKNVPPGIGWSVNQFSYPAAAVEFIQQERLTELSGGQLYNSYNFGGYLTWAWHPSKIFIDGRVRPYQGEITERYWNNFKGGEVWQDSIGRYNLTVALITHPHVAGGVVYNNVSRMFLKEQWALIYYDDTAAVYARRMPALQNVISRLEYQYLDPQMIDVSYLGAKLNGTGAAQRVLVEIERSLALNPHSYRLHFNAAYVYGELGQFDRMRDELARVLQINPRFEPARRILEELRTLP